MYKFQCILILLTFLTISVNSQVDTISFVDFSGNKRTRSNYLLRFIDIKKGNIADSVSIAEDMRRLRTLSSVLMVTPFIIPTDSGNLLRYQIKERWTLLPVGDFGITGNSLWIGAGAMESNLFGRGIYTYLYVEYGTPYAFHFILRNPYLFGSKWGIEAISKLSNETENWEYAENGFFRKSYISVAAKYELRFEKDIYFGIKFQQDELMNKLEDELFKLESRQTMSGFVKLMCQKIDYRNFYLSGWKNYFLYEQQFSPDNKSVFLIRDDFFYFQHYRKSNLAYRLSFGISNEKKAGYLPFIADSYNNIRGSGYRMYKGNRIATLNCEYRYTIYDKRFLGIQLVAFTDIGNIKAEINNSVIHEKNLIHAGPGLRLIFTKAYNALLSVDYGINLQDPVKSSFVLGWGQYF